MSKNYVCQAFGDLVKLLNGEVILKVRTYICVRTLVGSGTGEADEFMAPFVDHKTAH